MLEIISLMWNIREWKESAMTTTDKIHSWKTNKWNKNSPKRQQLIKNRLTLATSLLDSFMNSTLTGQMRLKPYD